MNATTTEDPATIERDIRETQDNMSKTVDKIGEQLSVKNLFNSLMGKAGQSNINVQSLTAGAKRNPVAVALIAAGAIWLATGKGAKMPKMGKSRVSPGSPGQAKVSTKAKARQFTGSAKQQYDNAPLIGGLLAAAVGAAAGAGVPISRTEKEKLGSIGEKARDVVSQQKQQVTAHLLEKKDTLLEKADEKLKSVVSSGKNGSTESGISSEANQPFMAQS